MHEAYCPHCDMRRGFSKRWGVGTGLLILLTFGLWTLAMPMYPSRCIQCGSMW